jgi:hypothetical protein
MAARAKSGVVSYQKPASLPSSVVRLRLLRTEPLQCVQSLHRSDLAVHIHQSLVVQDKRVELFDQRQR